MSDKAEPGDPGYIDETAYASAQPVAGSLAADRNTPARGDSAPDDLFTGAGPSDLAELVEDGQLPAFIEDGDGPEGAWNAPATVRSAGPAAPVVLPSAHMPAPLEGCLYCHSVGTTTLTEAKPVLGIVSVGAVLTCSSCGATATFESGTGPLDWRIRYRTFNRSSRFYYVMVYLGLSGWLDAEAALDRSRRGFTQRYRLQQAQHGDLSWLSPHRLTPPPALMSPSETLYVRFNNASLMRRPSGGRLAVVLTRGEGLVQDTGSVLVTDQKVHLLGKSRDWSHKLSEIGRIEHNERYWRLHIPETGQYYQGNNAIDEIDAQLFTVTVQHLIAH